MEVLEITDLRDFDRALSTIPKPRDLADWDNRIRGLQKDKAILNARITRKEADWAQSNQKTGEALSLLTQFQSYVGQPGDVVTKARIFDETVAKGLPENRNKGRQHRCRLQCQDGDVASWHAEVDDRPSSGSTTNRIDRPDGLSGAPRHRDPPGSLNPNQGPWSPDCLFGPSR